MTASPLRRFTAVSKGSRGVLGRGDRGVDLPPALRRARVGRGEDRIKFVAGNRPRAHPRACALNQPQFLSARCCLNSQVPSLDPLARSGRRERVRRSSRAPCVATD